MDSSHIQKVFDAQRSNRWHIAQSSAEQRIAKLKTLRAALLTRRHEIVVAMQKDCDGLCLMAMHGETPVGFIFGYLEEQDDSRIETYTGKQLYVSDGFVMPDYRHRGIYRQMNALMEQHYTDMGVKRFLRFTHIRNTGMRSLLEADGYFVSRLLYEKWL